MTGPDLPPAPVNVKVHLRSGEVFPVECVYAETNDEGMEVWEVIQPFVVEDIERVEVDELPARTAIVVSEPRKP
jgi:D-hexose-6-phosphate mutarotase